MLEDVCRYKVDQIGTNIITSSDQYGVYMVFEGVVENTISEYQIGPKTLATRVGGIIGVGKNLLWILIFALTSLGTFLTYSRTFMKIK